MSAPNGSAANGVNGTHAELKYTKLDDIPVIREELIKSFRTGIMYPLQKRKQQLSQMARMLQENASRWQEAIFSDIGKPPFQALLFELGLILQAMDAIKNLEEWTKPETPTVPPHQKSFNPTVHYAPKGVILIISPWNYPLTLTVQPLVSALAAGNCAVLKPSELAPATAALFAELVPKYFDPGVVRVVNGGVEETTKVLSLPWDHIFYTGNGIVGRIVATAAAKHLTPCTLELGGKSPVVIDPNTDLDLAARRILWGKTNNAGQTCVAPDFVLCPPSAQPGLIAGFEKAMKEFYPETDGDALASSAYGRIVNERHFKRVMGMVKKSKGEVVVGGKRTDEKRNALEPIILKTDASDDLMKEEIFGPILPIITIKDMDEAIEFIEDRDHPLALYVFTDDQVLKDKFLARTRSGSLIFNDTFGQLGVLEVPFGGVGASGYGHSVGLYGFRGFTHLRSSMDIPKEVEPHNYLRYPPYTQDKVDLATSIVIPKEIPVFEA